MFNPSTKYSSEVLYYTFGVYLEARLKAEPIAAGLVGLFEKAQRELISSNDRELKARIAAQIARAARDHESLEMERLISKFEMALLTTVDRNRMSPMYKFFFPDGLKTIGRIGSLEKIERAKVLESALAGLGRSDVVDKTAPVALGHVEKTETGPAVSLKVWLPRFTAQRIKLEAAVSARLDAKVSHTDAQAFEVKQRAHWTATYDAVHVDLLKLFPGDRKKVNSFFHARPRRREDDAKPATPAT